MAISDIEILDESQRRRFDKLYAKAVAGELSADDIVDDEFFTEVVDISPHDKNEGKTFLWWPALHKNWQLVNRLINKNADVHTTQFEKMLTQCRKSINKLSDPSNEMVLKVYASEIAKIYNPKLMIFSTETQGQDPEREPKANQSSSSDEDKCLSGGALYSAVKRNLKSPVRPNRDR